MTYFVTDIIRVDHDLGEEQFPATFTLVLEKDGIPKTFTIARNDEYTRMLSPEVFRQSHMLPSGLMTDDNKNDFAFYSSNADNFVLHRPDARQISYIYGKITVDGNALFISPIVGSDTREHRIRRAVGRQRRSLPIPGSSNILELGIYLAPDVHTYFDNIFATLGFSSRGQLARTYCDGIARDLDTIMKNMTIASLRVYLSWCQSSGSLDAWYDDNLTGNNVLDGQAALPQFNTFIQGFVASMSLPSYDHAIALTRSDISDSNDGGQAAFSVSAIDSLCSSDSVSIAEVGWNLYLKAAAQAILKSAGVTKITGSSYFVMSTNIDIPPADKASQPWRVKGTTQGDLQTYIHNNGGCLVVEDSSFDFPAFISQSTFGQAFSYDNQCKLVHGDASTQCDAALPDLCYIGISCTNPNNGKCKRQVFVGDRTGCDTGLQCRQGSCQVDAFTTTAGAPVPSTTASPTSTTPLCEEQPVGRILIDLTYIPCPDRIP